MKHTRISRSASFAISMFFAKSALAQTGTGGGTVDLNGIQTILCNVLNWLFTFSLIAGVIFIIFGAFTYMTSGGSEEKVTSANKAMMYAVIGIAIAIVAKGVPFIIGDLLKITTTLTTCP